ncbi:U32 family peptidase, partial [[Clostridium] innocuum]|nr:U32 family peptidase [[Clostridium] innocuum]
MWKTERKVELLAPAGSMEALRAAVQNGCDAVYLGGSMFGARAFANNFDEDEIQEAIAYAHVYGVRVFVTVNTLIREEEFEDCVRYVQFLYEHDVDAVIIQDLGLFSVLRQRFPDMELHASTQMHIHNPQGIHFIESCGASRVVVPRETPLKEIRAYAALGVDLEVFVQGALCVSYSGQCLMSSLTLQRSGNRGECAQNCRMKYQLEKREDGHSEILQGKGEYLLSPKDMNTLERVPELIEAGIASFKIEGRMKRPEYVALMVALYRKAIDAYYEGRAFIYDEAVDMQMKKIFNRGFTQGHLFHHYGAQLMNPIRPNHIGVKVGKVIQVTRDKIVIRLQDTLRQQDGIRILQEPKDIGFQVNFLYKDGLLVNHGAAGDIVELDKTAPVVKGSIVLKTSDAQQLQALQKSYEAAPRKVAVYAQFTMQAGKPAVLEIMDEEGRSVRVESDAVCETARRMPLKEERIAAQLKKSGDTPFVFENISYQLDAQGILPIRELNQMRRSALAKLEEQRKILHKQRRILAEKQPVIHSIQDAPSLCAVVHTEEQLQACLQEGLDMIFVENHSLYALMKGTEGVYPRMPRVMKEEYPASLMMIQETGGLQAGEVFCDTSLNMTNSHTAAFLLTHGARGISFSLESSLQDCSAIKRCFQERYAVDAPFFYTVY